MRHACSTCSGACSLFHSFDVTKTSLRLIPSPPSVCAGVGEEAREKRCGRRGGGGEVEERGGGNSRECGEEWDVRVSALGEVVSADGVAGGGGRGASCGGVVVAEELCVWKPRACVLNDY